MELLLQSKYKSSYHKLKLLSLSAGYTVDHTHIDSRADHDRQVFPVLHALAGCLDLKLSVWTQVQLAAAMYYGTFDSSITYTFCVVNFSLLLTGT